MPLFIYCFPCLFVFYSFAVKSPFFLPVFLTHKHRLTMAGILTFPLSVSYIFLFKWLFFSIFLCCSYLTHNLPSFSSPTSIQHHRMVSSSTLRCIYYRGLLHEWLCKVRVKVACLRITPFFQLQSPSTDLFSAVYGVVSSCLLTCIL